MTHRGRNVVSRLPAGPLTGPAAGPITRLGVALAVGLAALGCLGQPPSSTPPAGVSPVVYHGARVIPGDGSPPIDDAVVVVDNGTIAAVGAEDEVSVPALSTRVDLTGKTVMPALVSLHVHVGYQDGLSYEATNYTAETIVDHLDRYAYYGVGTVVSLGTDAGSTVFEIRQRQDDAALPTARLRTAGRGLAAPNAGPGSPALRASALGVTTEEEARQSVAELVAQPVDVVKIWVDDRNGSVEKLAPELQRAIIEEAHAHGVKVIAHVFYYDDAVELVRAGVDGFAHLVRDRVMDDALVAAVVERDVFVMPNLGVSERRAHSAPPAWLDDPRLAETVSPEVIARAAGRYEEITPAEAAQGRARYEAMERSVSRLIAAGARVVLGADSGVQDHFPGYAELRELELMVAAGLSASQAIEASTRRAADALGLDEVGSLTPGRSADFIVLDADPLVDMANLRQIAAVYLRGQAVDRDALRAGWTSR